MFNSKYCCQCNNRVIPDSDHAGHFECCECGSDDWYDVSGITRHKVQAYLLASGWTLDISDKYIGPRREGQVWTKKGYDYMLALDWLECLDSNGACMFEEAQIQRAVYRTADAEGIGFADVAARMKE